MADAGKRPATYENVLSSPDHVVAEIVFGTLYQSPRLAALHAIAASAVGEELGPPFKRGRGTVQGDVVVRLKPFDAIEFPLGVLWQR